MALDADQLEVLTEDKEDGESIVSVIEMRRGPGETLARTPSSISAAETETLGYDEQINAEIAGMTLDESQRLDTASVAPGHNLGQIFASANDQNSDDDLLEELGKNTQKTLADKKLKKQRKKESEKAAKKLAEDQAKLGLRVTTAKELKKQRENERKSIGSPNSDCACDEIRKDPRLKTKVCVLL